jgi:hypothetical protein
MKKLDRLSGFGLDQKKGQLLAFANDSKNDPAKGL